MKPLYFLLLLLAVSGCQNPPEPPAPQAHQPLIFLTNYNRGVWYSGIVLVLSNVPDARTIEALGAAGAVPSDTNTALIWNIPNYDWRNQEQIYAIDLARQFGVVMHPLRP